MSVLTDVLMEALDDRSITPEEASRMMRQYYSEGAVRDAIDNAARVMDSSREDRAATIEQIKSNGALKDAEKNVKKYCAQAYKTMLKYSRPFGIKDNSNGPADMKNIINGINAALKTYHNAEKVAEKSDKSQIDAVAKKVIDNLNKAQKCFANDGTPNRDALKKLAENTRIEYHNIDASDVDAKAPEKEKKTVKESSEDIYSEGFMDNVKAKFAKKKEPEKVNTSTANASTKDKSSTAKNSESAIVAKAVANCTTIRTGANGAMMDKANLVKKRTDDETNYDRASDIKSADRNLSHFADMIKTNMEKIKDLSLGKKYIPILNRVVNYIQNAVHSTNSKDISAYRESMMMQKLVFVESCPVPNGNSIMEGAASDLYSRYKYKRLQIDNLTFEYRQNMNTGNKDAAKKNLKDMQTIMKGMKKDLQMAREDRSILETLGQNVLWSAAYSAIQILPCLLVGVLAANPATFGLATVAYYPAVATVTVGNITNLITMCYQVMNAFDDKGTSGSFHFNDLSVSIGVMARIIDKLDGEINAKVLALN